MSDTAGPPLDTPVSEWTRAVFRALGWQMAETDPPEPRSRSARAEALRATMAKGLDRALGASLKGRPDMPAAERKALMQRIKRVAERGTAGEVAVLMGELAPVAPPREPASLADCAALWRGAREAAEAEARRIHDRLAGAGGDGAAAASGILRIGELFGLGLGEALRAIDAPADAESRAARLAQAREIAATYRARIEGNPFLSHLAANDRVSADPGSVLLLRLRQIEAMLGRGA